MAQLVEHHIGMNICYHISSPNMWRSQVQSPVEALRLIGCWKCEKPAGGFQFQYFYKHYQQDLIMDSIESFKEGKESCTDVKELKKKYSILMNKYNLPGFKELDEEFDILKIDSNSETLLREVRKLMILKFSAVLNFIELILNPTNGSMFHMFLVKGINNFDKKIMDNLFERLGEIELNSFKLDINYSEESEAEFIKSKFEIWQEIKPELTKILDSLQDNWNKTAYKKEKSYFG